MTWRDAVRGAAEQLKAAEIDDHSLNARYIAAHVLGVWQQAELRPLLEQEITHDQLAQYRSLISRRLQQEPLQYIIGETEFYGLRLKCTPAALIPRPETEILVEQAIELARKMLDMKQHLDVLDIGTGTGAIALAFAYHIPASHVTAIDASLEAIELATENKNGLADARTSFKVLDAFDDSLIELGKFDLILSNPPYISTSEYAHLPQDVQGFEPRMALTDESDGFVFYRRMAQISPEMLNPNGAVVLELSYDGAARVAAIIEESGFRSISTIKDLSGIERILIAKL
jgi:release factor glutamine methyltransferase